jgi:hypothetical protein
MAKTKQPLIWYFKHDGWHVGYVVRRGYKWTRVKRILPYRATPTKRGIRAQFANVRTKDTKEPQ